jgi:hypothetical protein
VTSDRREETLLACHSSLPFVVIVEANDVVFSQIITELDFDEGKRLGRAIAEAMIGFNGDMYMLALLEL